MLLRPVLMPILRNPLQGIADGIRNMLAELLGSSQFFAPLTHSLVLARGTGSPTFTRASTATFRDWEGVLKTVPSGCARFEGARMVRNLVASSEDLTSGWAANNAGSVTATTITFTASAGDGWNVTAFSGTAGNVYVWSCLVSTDSGTKNIRFRVGGAALSANVQVTTTPVRVSVVMTATAAAAEFGIYNGSDAVAGAINCTEIQLEDVTGQADQTASEYVSVGVLSDPWHGAGVDGVEFFNTDRDGAVLPAATNTGYLAEGARTQILPTADIRDMTTAAWTLGATMTRARTSVGADGAANSATRLTGGAVAATNTCYTTITAAASSRTYSALVKRITGTGPVRIVQTGTETDISSLINSSTYTLVELNASILNAVMGFKIDTNGDAIDVDFNQFEAGAFASSRIAAAVTRAADVLTYPSAGNIDGTVGWCYAEITYNQLPASGVAFISGYNGGTLGGYAAFVDNSPQELSLWDGTTDSNVGAISYPITTPTKIGTTWGGTTTRGAVAGTVVSAGFDGNMNFTSASLAIGSNPSGNSNIFGTIRNARIGQRQLSASEMQAITA